MDYNSCTIENMNYHIVVVDSIVVWVLDIVIDVAVTVCHDTAAHYIGVEVDIVVVVGVGIVVAGDVSVDLDIAVDYGIEVFSCLEVAARAIFGDANARLDFVGSTIVAVEIVAVGVLVFDGLEIAVGLGVVAVVIDVLVFYDFDEVVAGASFAVVIVV